MTLAVPEEDEAPPQRLQANKMLFLVPGSHGKRQMVRGKGLGGSLTVFGLWHVTCMAGETPLAPLRG